MQNPPTAFFGLLWLWMASSSFVAIEPSPHDYLFVLLFVVAIAFSYLSFRYDALIPLILMGIFFSANLLSLYFSFDYLDRTLWFLGVTFYLLVTWFFLVGTLQTFGSRILNIIFSGYMFAALLAAVVGIMAYFGWIPWADLFLKYAGMRVSSVFKDANVFGPFLIPAVLYGIYLFENKRDFIVRVLCVIAIIILTVGVLLSFSRAAIGHYFISLLLYFFLPSAVSLKKRIVTISAIVIFLLPCILIILNQPQVNDLLLMRAGFQEYDSNRFGTQLASLKMAMERPLGIGPGLSEPVFAYATHNTYVRILTEYGVLGILSYLYFIALTLMRSFRHCFNITAENSRFSAVVTATLAGILLSSLVIDTLHWRHFWLFLALPWIPLDIEGDI